MDGEPHQRRSHSRSRGRCRLGLALPPFRLPLLVCLLDRRRRVRDPLVYPDPAQKQQAQRHRDGKRDHNRCCLEPIVAMALRAQEGGKGVCGAKAWERDEEV